METQPQKVVVSAAHITLRDSFVLEDMGTANPMITPCDSGYIFTLCDEAESNQRPELSATVNRLIREFWQKGVRQIEFDRYGEQLKGYPIFDW